jgi:hypothetical protein
MSGRRTGACFDIPAGFGANPRNRPPAQRAGTAGRRSPACAGVLGCGSFASRCSGVSENARRYSATCDALLAAVNTALLSLFRSSSQLPMYPACRSSPLIPRWAQRNHAPATPYA